MAAFQTKMVTTRRITLNQFLPKCNAPLPPPSSHGTSGAGADGLVQLQGRFKHASVGVPSWSTVVDEVSGYKALGIESLIFWINKWHVSFLAVSWNELLRNSQVQGVEKSSPHSPQGVALSRWCYTVPSRIANGNMLIQHDICKEWQRNETVEPADWKLPWQKYWSSLQRYFNSIILSVVIQTWISSTIRPYIQSSKIRLDQTWATKNLPSRHYSKLFQKRAQKLPMGCMPKWAAHKTFTCQVNK